MNFKKFLIVVVAAVALIAGFKYFTRVNQTNPVSVGNAFTKAMRSGDTATASLYFAPERAERWRSDAAERLKTMRSGTKERFFEAIPSSPDFAPAPGASATAMTLLSADKAFSLELTQSGGKWYVSKGPI